MHIFLDAARADADGKQAQALIRRCVHCGFCNSACPTYLQLGEENNGPRGRIYQIKAFFEGAAPTAVTLKNLDQCLTCQACESACPSGVQYGELLELARPKIAATVGRTRRQRFTRRAAIAVLTRPRLLRLLLALARPWRALLPAKLRTLLRPAPRAPWQIGKARAQAGMVGVSRAGAEAVFAAAPAAPAHVAAGDGRAADATSAGEAGGGRAEESRAAAPLPDGARIVLYDGCVQSATRPEINARAAAVCAAAGLQVERVRGFCCGALQWHLEDQDAALARIRANVDNLHGRLQSGARHIVSTASGCGRMVATYGDLLADDPAYAARAKAVSAVHQDLSCALAAAPRLDNLTAADGALSYHCPCTLQHAQGGGAVAQVFSRLGAKLQTAPDGGKCCGSAGLYSQEHPAMARRLRDDRLAHFFPQNPDAILTANIGCQLHLQSGTDIPVRHWIEAVTVRGGAG